MKFNVEKKAFSRFTLTIESELEATLLLGAYYRTTLEEHARDAGMDPTDPVLNSVILNMSAAMNVAADHIGKADWLPLKDTPE